ELVAEVIASRPHVIFVGATPTLMALFNQHPTVPVVFVIGIDPIELGVVQSLAHPGGVFTGLFNNADDHGPKNVPLMRDLLPQARRVAFLRDANFGTARLGKSREKMIAVAEGLGFEATFVEYKSGEELPSAFDRMDAAKVEAIVCGGGPLWGRNRLAIIALE